MSIRQTQLRVEVPAGVGRPRAERLVAAEELRGWLPVDALAEEGRPVLRWLDMNGVALSEPFFRQTVERVERERPGAELYTDFDALIQLEKLADALRPDGFIFHSSRCGSTLVSNACRALDGSVVVAEAAPVDKLVWRYLSPEGGTESLLRRVFLRAVVNLLGRRRPGDARRYFIKFSCCSVLRLSFVRSIWQDVPWVFIHRDPVEVMVSNLKTVPEWMQFESEPEMAAAVSGLEGAEATRLSREEYCARALGRFYAEASAAADERVMLVGYEELSASKLTEVVRFFGATPTDAEARRISRAAALYAKDPVPARPFVPDGEAKRASASPLVREMAERFAAEPYRLLLSKKRVEADTRQ